MLVGAAADEERHAAGRHVAPRHAPEHALDLEFALVPRQGRRFRQELPGRHVGKQIVDLADADLCQHLGAVFGGERQITHASRTDVQETLCRAATTTSLRTELAM